MIPNCSDILNPLESSIGGLQYKNRIQWTEELRQHILNVQSMLSSNKTITLPILSEELWIVTDGSVSQRGLGGTMYAICDGKLNLDGFFSAKFSTATVSLLYSH